MDNHWCQPTQSDSTLHVWLGFGKLKHKKIVDRHTGKILERIPSKVTCDRCKKRFKPRVRMCMDDDCWHMFVPPHK